MNVLFVSLQDLTPVQFHRVEADGFTHAIADLIPKPWHSLSRATGTKHDGIFGLGQAHSVDGADQR